MGIFDSIGEWVASTRLPEQVREVDFAGLFTNPWFLVPFIALAGYLLYKQAFRDLVILGAILGDRVQTGCNSVTSPGTLIGPDSFLMPNVTAPSGAHPRKSVIR